MEQTHDIPMSIKMPRPCFPDIVAVREAQIRDGYSCLAMLEDRVRNAFTKIGKENDTSEANKMSNEKKKKLRYFLKDDIRQETDFSNTKQNMGIKAPPIEKPCGAESPKIILPFPDEWKNIGDVSLTRPMPKGRGFSDQRA